MKIVIVGIGRAGSSIARAAQRAGHDVTLRHHDEVHALPDTDAIVLCVPDDAIATMARQIAPTSAVVMHVAGSRQLNVLAPHARVASMHPLVALPNGEVGADRLTGAVFAVAGDELAFELARSLGGRPMEVRDEDRARYHAAACMAANHLVALLDTVATVAESVGMSVEDFLPLAQSAIDDVTALGPTAALTGPASRGDLATIDAHLAALPDELRSSYVALANAALAIGERRRANVAK